MSFKKKKKKSKKNKVIENEEAEETEPQDESSEEPKKSKKKKKSKKQELESEVVPGWHNWMGIQFGTLSNWNWIGNWLDRGMRFRVFPIGKSNPIGKLESNCPIGFLLFQAPK